MYNPIVAVTELKKDSGTTLTSMKDVKIILNPENLDSTKVVKNTNTVLL